MHTAADDVLESDGVGVGGGARAAHRLADDGEVMEEERLETGHAEGDERAADLGVLDRQHGRVDPRLVDVELAFDDEVETHAGDAVGVLR